MTERKFSEMAAPKSDQINADDLVAGPIDITVTRVTTKAGDQPMSVFSKEMERPWKPCKTMMKWMAEAWATDDPQAVVGKRIRLYNDRDVDFGGFKTGGIRISHLSHISEAIPLQEGNRRKLKTLKVKWVYPIDSAPSLRVEKTAPKPAPEPEPDPQSTDFDFDGWDNIVGHALAQYADHPADLKDWWAGMIDTRKEARDADADRAGKIATKVNNALQGE